MLRLVAIHRLARTFADCTGGNVMMIFALALPIVVGAGAFGVETTYLYYKRTELQSAADASAHAAASERRSGGTVGEVAQVAFAVARDNGFAGTAADIAVFAPPESGAFAGEDAVEVQLDKSERRFFTAVFFDDTIPMSARAVAQFRTGATACVLALDQTAQQAILVSGNASTRFIGCSVMANSNASNAVELKGSARMEAPCVISGGGIVAGSGLTLTTCQKPIIQAPPVADPFRARAQPNLTGACQSSSGPTLSPGRYCSGLRLSGDVTLSPGVYAISGGDLRVSANARISGVGVTLFLDSNVQMDINGNATLDLSAPTTGPYAGMLIFGDRDSGGTTVLNGTAASRLTGAIYMPKRTVRYLGNYSGNDGCTQVVANRIEWSGSTTVAVNCSKYGMEDVAALALVQLVE